MLQQTTVSVVIPYFGDFIARWPTVEDLAAADLDAVLHAWQGLGYYARARNLHKCAQVVMADYGGCFPDTEKGLATLPGIGPYTAAAVAAIAFSRPAAAIDGNVIRVITRLYGLQRPLPGVKGDVRKQLGALAPSGRPGDFAQALMDLGATVCTPRNPSCKDCPWAGDCRGLKLGDPARLPISAPKKARPIRRGVAFWLVRKSDGAVFLRRRPDTGLLGGMIEVPSTDWQEHPQSPAAVRAAAPVPADWRPLPQTIRHTFTHFHLELEVWTATVGAFAGKGIWSTIDELGTHALPTVMKKIIRCAVGERTRKKDEDA